MSSRSRLLTPILWATALCLCAAALPAQPTAVPPAETAGAGDAQLVAALDELFRGNYPAAEPGAAVIVVRRGETLLRKGYGMANLELDVPMEPDMVFRLASMTKQFTAAAVMLLVEEGKITLDAPITTYLPDFPTQGRPVTVDHLLTHTSGIKSYTSLPGWRSRVMEDLRPQQVIDLFKDEPLDFEPGEGWSYSNSGYFLLGAIIEKVSGESYARFVEQRIFAPLGMESTRYGRPRRVVPRRAAGYAGPPGAYRNAAYISMDQAFAAGGLLSSVDDLARWDASLYTDQLLSTASRRRMWTSQRLPDGRDVHYGYGWGLAEYEGHRLIHHGGGIDGFVTCGVRLPDDEVFVAVLSNNPGAPRPPQLLAMEAATLVIGKPPSQRVGVRVAPEILDDYVGVYAVADRPEEIGVVTREGEDLFVQLGDGGKHRLLAASDSEFLVSERFDRGRFERDEEGEVVRVLMSRFIGPDVVAVKTDRPVPPPRRVVEVDPAVFDDLVGVYDVEAGFPLRVFREGDQLYVLGPAGRRQLLPESESRYVVPEESTVIEFIRGPAGKAEELILQRGSRRMSARRREGGGR